MRVNDVAIIRSINGDPPAPQPQSILAPAGPFYLLK